jgi:hypothetical protein
MKKKFLSVLLTLTLVFSLTSVPAYASEITAEGDGTVPVNLTVETPIYDVTVPMVLPVTMTETGDIVVATDAVIVNKSAGPIKISNIKTKGVNGWSTTDYTGLDVKSAKVGSKNVGLTFTIDGMTTNTTGADLNDFSGAIILIKGESLPLIYNAKVPAQKVAQTDVQIAEVVFTVGWDD